MRKISFLFYILIFGVMVFAPIRIHAVTVDEETAVYRLDKSTDTCDPSGLLGDPRDENSVAWLLQEIFNYIKVLGPIMVVVFSSVDFIKVIINSDDDQMKKAGKKLGIRIILALSLFFIPTIIQVLLYSFGITANPTCGIQ